MHWEILIIPLIALGVWIIGTLFKSEDEKAKKSVRSRGNLPGRAPGRRPVTDLDRFLEEARRRREAEDRPKPAPAPPSSRVPAPRPPLRERLSPPREAPRLSVPALPKEEILDVLPVVRPTAPPTVAEPVAVAPRALESAKSSPTPTLSPRFAPVPQQVRSLLSKPQTAAAAFVLREIFDRPLCKRRR
jgi:hypothetical protein